MPQAKEKYLKLIIVILLLLILLLLGLYIVCTRVIPKNDSEEIDYSTVDYSTIDYSDLEEKGLALYKFMTGNGVSPFTWENGAVTNYDEVMSRMTTSYRNSFSTYGGHGFSIPYYDEEDGIWKSYGGNGTTYESNFKSIKVIGVTPCLITYEITFTYRKLQDKSIPQTTPPNEGKNIFVVKTNKCSDDDPDQDFTNGYKVESFDLIFGLQF